MTQHLSLLHTASLFSVSSILLLLAGKLLPSAGDTARSTTSPAGRCGVSRHFSDWGRMTGERLWRSGDSPLGKTFWVAQRAALGSGVSLLSRRSFEEKGRPRLPVQRNGGRPEGRGAACRYANCGDGLCEITLCHPAFTVGLVLGPMLRRHSRLHELILDMPCYILMSFYILANVTAPIKLSSNSASKEAEFDGCLLNLLTSN